MNNPKETPKRPVAIVANPDTQGQSAQPVTRIVTNVVRKAIMELYANHRRLVLAGVAMEVAPGQESSSPPSEGWLRAYAPDGRCQDQGSKRHAIQIQRIEQLLDWVKAAFKRCEEHEITLSETKYQVGTEVKYAGYLDSDKSTKPDPEKVAAISQFPIPENLTDLRSFLGLANQFSDFSPDLRHAMEPMKAWRRKTPLYGTENTWLHWTRSSRS